MTYHTNKEAEMAKFNKSVSTGAQSPVKSTKAALNAELKSGFARDQKSELFLLAVSNFVGQDTFYEKAQDRDDRFSKLCHEVAVQDSIWFLGFVAWLRNEAFMRSASVVAAAEGAKALIDSGHVPGVPRALVGASMARADEPGEFLAYWTSKYGKNLPAAVKKGVADGAKHLYNEYSLLKYDTDSKGFRFADVLQLSHAKADGPNQNDLFKYALERRYNTSAVVPEDLWMVRTRANLMSAPVEKRRALLGTSIGRETLKKAGITWEALSGWLQGPMDKQAWEAVIPNMGHMALLRNVRNFQEAGVSASVLKDVLAKISDPERVATGKQFPFRYLAAYQANKGNLKVSAALEEALEASLSNVPSLSGRTLILVDRSGSMFGYHRTDSELTMADKAAIFGSALALRAEDADLVQFGSAWSRQAGYERVSFRKGDSLLPMLNKFKDMGGTDTQAAVDGSFRAHDRVIIITDEQYNGWGGDPLQNIPVKTPVYTWNLEGYAVGQSESGSKKRHTFGGLTDKGFQMIPLIEAGQSQQWPWEA
jgi:hypothetical protein